MTLYKKPTDSRSYLHYNSCHPVHIKNSIIYSQFLGFKRICTRNTDFIDHSKKSTTHLLRKAYPIKVITKQWNEVTKIPRAELLIQKQQTSTNCLPLEQTYHPTIVPTYKAVMKEWKSYSNMPASKHLFSSTTLCKHRQPPNLNKCSSRQESPLHQPLPITIKSMKFICQICNIIKTRPSLKIPGTNTNMRPGNNYCNSSNVIHIINCRNVTQANTLVRHLLSLDAV